MKWTGWLAVAAIALSAARASADDDAQASAYFKAGAAAYDAGDYKRAAASFEAAYLIAPRGAAAYNAAVAWEAAGDLARAADAYDRALAQKGLTKDETSDAESRLRRLIPKLGTVEVRGPEDARVSVAHITGAHLPLVARVMPGTYDARIVHADNSSVTKRFTVLPGGQVVLEDHPAAPAAPASPEQPPPAEAKPEPRPDVEKPRVAPQKPEEEPPASSSDDGWNQRKIGWYTLGAGAVLSVGTAVLGGLALYDRDQYYPARTDHDLYDTTYALRTLTNVCLTAAIVTVVGGAVLVLTAPKVAPAAPSAALENPLFVRF